MGSASVAETAARADFFGEEHQNRSIEARIAALCSRVTRRAWVSERKRLFFVAQ